MKILVTGGTGFIGQRLVTHLIGEGHEVQLLTRDISRAKKQFSQSPVESKLFFINSLDDAVAADAVINLAGEPLFAKRWNTERKRRFAESRIATTTALVSWMAKSPPRVFLSGSAIGYYGDKGDQDIGENAPPAEYFASRLVQDWEQVALPAQELGVRVCLLRTGLVVGPNGGFLAQMLPPFKLGLGGPLGSGQQWMSWIHLEDMVGIIDFCLSQPVSGPINCTAPNPVTNQAFSATLAGVLNRPAILRTPAAILKLVVGEGAYMLLTGQKVLPENVLASGYRFRYPQLREALENVMENIA